jgi:hypothetical protein
VYDTLKSPCPDAAGIRALCVFLESHGIPQGMSRMRMHSLKNEVMDKLRGATDMRATFSDLLIRIFHDGGQDIVIRDYAVQHLASWYPAAPDPQQVENTLWEAVQETGSSIAGTALLGLYHLSESDSRFDRLRIGKAALQMALSEDCGDLSRITAVQVCGRMGITDVRPTAMALARAGRELPLRLASVATLGDLGDERALTDLMGKESSPLLKAACESALKKIRKRANGGPSHVEL